jgi:hypothetical protein
MGERGEGLCEVLEQTLSFIGDTQLDVIIVHHVTHRTTLASSCENVSYIRTINN